MHIEPGIVVGAKLVLGQVTALGAVAYGFKRSLDTMRDIGIAAFAGRSVAATALVFSFFEILPHFPVGVSEVHFILGSTLFLMLGMGPTAVGLMCGLMLQSFLLAPADLPQLGMNLTTLLVPLFAMRALARRIIAPDTAYADLGYRQVLLLSTAYQAGVVGWVAFWAFYGQGMGAENLNAVVTFAGAYAMVLLVEPVVDLGLLALVKSSGGLRGASLLNTRLFDAT